MSLPSPHDILKRLHSSAFRARFTLEDKELTYLDQQGIDKIMSHAHDFIAQQLAPVEPKNDSKQTPFDLRMSKLLFYPLSNYG